ncbi:MAG: hypothetical protein Kow00117_18680 [Phototrophicales bacterium]
MSIDPFVNQEFENIRVLERLAVGGMAVVYRAYDTRRNVQVALKLIHEQYAHHQEAIKRFEREIEIAQRLQHPNIVRVYDYGRWNDRLYMTMQFMDGGSLLDPLVRNIPVPPEQVAAWIEQISSALDYAHKQGIIHRDLKPGNVLLDSSHKAHLSDFGIARLSDAAKLTRTGLQMPGTAHYMSPEQVSGENLLPQSDIYALAVLAYVFMVRQYPFDGDSEMAIAFKHVNDPVPMPSQVNPRLPKELDAVIARGLAKKPEDRYPTALAFSAAFNQALGVTPFQAVATRPKSPQAPPTARQPTPTPYFMPPSEPKYPPRQSSMRHVYGLIGLGVLLGLFGLILFIALGSDRDGDDAISLSTLDTPNVVAQVTSEVTEEPTATSSLTPTSTATLTLTATQTLSEPVILDSTETSTLTVTQTPSPTNTPTDISIDLTALRQSAQATATQIAREATHTPTNTATSTASPTITPTATPSITSSPTAAQVDMDATVTAIVEAVIATQTAAAAPPLLPPVTVIAINTYTGTAVPDEAIVTANIDANVRAGDSTSYAPVGALLDDESAPVLGMSQNGWFFIELDNGVEGWIAPSVVVFSGDIDTVEIIAPPTMTPTRTPTPTPTATRTPTPPSGPNLIGGTVFLSPNPPACGQALQVRITVTNNGTVSTTTTVTVLIQDIQASTGTVLNAFTQTVPVLSPGSGFLVSRAGWVLSAYPNEEHFIRVTIDSNNNQIESNESDNVRVSETFVLQPGSC